MNDDVHAIHHSNDHFGEDADEFRPERWLDEEGKKGLKVGWEYLPFNGGPRICIRRECFGIGREMFHCRQKSRTIRPHGSLVHHRQTTSGKRSKALDGKMKFDMNGVERMQSLAHASYVIDRLSLSYITTKSRFSSRLARALPCMFWCIPPFSANTALAVLSLWCFSYGSSRSKRTSSCLAGSLPQYNFSVLLTDPCRWISAIHITGISVEHTCSS